MGGGGGGVGGVEKRRVSQFFELFKREGHEKNREGHKKLNHCDHRGVLILL